MGAFSKLEQIINVILIKVFSIFKSMLAKIIPIKIKEKYYSFKLFLSNTKQRVLKAPELSQNYIVSLISIAKSLISRVINSLPMLLSKIKSLDKKYILKVPLEKISSKTKEVINKIRNLTKLSIFLISSLSLLVTISTYFIYSVYMEHIYTPPVKNNIKVTYRSSRPNYYKQTRRQVLITNIILPVYIESATSIKTLNIDIIVQFSNRYLKNHFDKESYILKDQIINSVAPSIPTFPLSIEGKNILRSKIKSALDSRIKELKIKGHIEKVMFHGVIAV